VPFPFALSVSTSLLAIFEPWVRCKPTATDPTRAKNRSRPRHYALKAQAIREKTVFIHEKPEIP
jgi:hypothetical protein